ncbi:MAG: peptidoglycan-binding protein [Fimbriimonadaceae bacterium]|nr:peptidoglycan-binding protein [Alphaproteobacteria bacterium]
MSFQDCLSSKLFLATCIALTIGFVNGSVSLANPTSKPIILAQSDEVEIVFWQSIKESGPADEIQTFLDTYPNSVFVPLARLRLKRLTGEGTPENAETPPPEKPIANATPIPAVPTHSGSGYLDFEVYVARASIEEISSPSYRSEFRIIKILTYGAARNSDLRLGDIIRSVNGYHPKTETDFYRWFGEASIGARVLLEIERAGTNITVEYVKMDLFAEAWKEAHKNNGQAMTNLARSYALGGVVTVDSDKAVNWIHKAIAAGDPNAYYVRGLMAEYWLSGKRSELGDPLQSYLEAGKHGIALGFIAASQVLATNDPERALQLAVLAHEIDASIGNYALYPRFMEQRLQSHAGYRLQDLMVSAAEYGNLTAQRDLGLEYVASEDIEHVRLGIGLIRRMADLGDRLAQRELGKLYKNGKGVEKNRTIAFAWLLKAAEAGDGEAQLQIGKAYYYGRGTQKNIEEAYKWFERASIANITKGHFYLGYLTGRGEGTPKDDEKAVEHYHRAAELGDRDAMLNLGIRYQVGRGVSKDLSEAANWYRQAMDAGNLRAHSGVGYMYRHGRGGYPKDPIKAVEVFRSAADQGIASALYNLGLMYRDGIGVERDLDEAVRLFRLALADEKRAKKALEKLGVPLYDPAEIQQLLVDLGYDPGPVDGKPASRTRAAVSAFQNDQNISADGELDVALLEQLRDAVKSAESDEENENQIANTANPEATLLLTDDQEAVHERLDNAFDF